MSERSKKIVIDYAMKQLQNALEDLKNGKAPNFPQSLKAIKDTIDAASKKVKDATIKEEDFDATIDAIAEKIEEKS